MGEVDLQREGAVAVCTIRPADGFMTIDTVVELDRLAAELEADDSVRALLFAGGDDGVFVRHYSVTELAGLSDALRARGRTFSADRLAPERDIVRLFGRLETMAKPVVVANAGHAMGGGFEFCLACDIRIAERGPYSLGLPEIGIGLLPGAGGTQRLARLVGPARALELCLRGRTVTPDEALALGMVHEVADRPVLRRALDVAAELSAKPQPALGHIKRLIRAAAAGAPPAEGLALERTLFLDTLVSDEAAERMARLNRGEVDIRMRRPGTPG